MINNKKITLITKLLQTYHNKDCPYCFEKLHLFFHKEDRLLGCGGGRIHPESLIIKDEDYLYTIDHIIKYGDLKELPKLKKLDEF